MSSSPSTLGQYPVERELGRGGMGVVYLARDPRLNRPVAIKVLPDALASHPESLARFEREAKLLASVNHPNVATIYGVEDTGGQRLLVLEYVPGDTLADRIARGPLPIDQALDICRQIASAIEAAHEGGVIHRDLKPGNVKITPDGQVKVLDFGLAKGGAATSDTDLAASPTLTHHATMAGVILGTAGYMSPEQARGKPVDRRTDIWSFGCVLFECLAGAQVFHGETVSDAIAKILERDPDWRVLPPQTPPKVRELLHRCLEKDLKKRQRDIGDARIELEEAVAARTSSASFVADAAPHAPVPTSRWRERSIWIGAVAVLLLTTGVLLWRTKSQQVAAVGPTVRAMIPFATVEALGVHEYPAMALSPDGRYLAYRGGTPPQLYMRAMDEGQSRPIAGTEGAYYPFFSPNGESLGFFSGPSRTIKRMAPSGGAPEGVITLTTANLRGVTWGDDDWIYYTPTVSAGLWRVRATGGAPEQLTTPDFSKGEKTHRYPSVLPGSKAVLFMVGTAQISSFDEARIEVLSLATRERHRLVDGGAYPQYATTGHVLYTRDGRLIAVPFDADRLKVTGAPVAVADNMFRAPFFGLSNYAVSRDGLFVRMVGGVSSLPQSVVAVDRHGISEPTKLPAVSMASAGWVSPKGTRLAASMTGATSQIALFDLTSGAFTKLTYEWDNEAPIWSPDGLRIAFISNQGGGPRNLYWQRADGGGSPERLTTSDHEQITFSWSADGKTIAYTDTDPTTGVDIWTVSIDDRKAAPLVKSPQDDGFPQFSPDGHWIAYQSNQSRKSEIYVQAFPKADRREQVSTDGGTQPHWRGNGEIVYKNGAAMMAVPIVTSPALGHGEPVKLFETSNVFLDFLPDGRLLMRTTTQPPPVTELEIVVNWFTELRRKVAGR